MYFLIDERRELGHARLATYTIELLYGAALEERKELFQEVKLKLIDIFQVWSV